MSEEAVQEVIEQKEVVELQPTDSLDKTEEGGEEDVNPKGRKRFMGENPENYNPKYMMIASIVCFVFGTQFFLLVVAGMIIHYVAYFMFKDDSNDITKKWAKYNLVMAVILTVYVALTVLFIVCSFSFPILIWVIVIIGMAVLSFCAVICFPVLIICSPVLLLLSPLLLVITPFLPFLAPIVMIVVFVVVFAVAMLPFVAILVTYIVFGVLMYKDYANQQAKVGPK